MSSRNVSPEPRTHQIAPRECPVHASPAPCPRQTCSSPPNVPSFLGCHCSTSVPDPRDPPVSRCPCHWPLCLCSLSPLVHHLLLSTQWSLPCLGPERVSPAPGTSYPTSVTLVFSRPDSPLLPECSFQNADVTARVPCFKPPANRIRSCLGPRLRDAGFCRADRSPRTLPIPGPSSPPGCLSGQIPHSLECQLHHRLIWEAFQPSPCPRLSAHGTPSRHCHCRERLEGGSSPWELPSFTGGVAGEGVPHPRGALAGCTAAAEGGDASATHQRPRPAQQPL